MVSCGMSAIKYILFIFNLVFTIAGLGIIVAGALILANVGPFMHFLEARVIAPPIILICTGAMIFIMAFLGCYGAIKEHYNLLIAFSIMMLVIFVTELAVGITAAVFKGDFDSIMRRNLEQSMYNYTNTDKLTWDHVQMQFECCGIDKADDWNRNPGYATNLSLPSSCCKDIQPGEICKMYGTKMNRKGCYETLQGIIQNSATILISIGIGVALVEIAGVILACCLASAIRKEGDK